MGGNVLQERGVTIVDEVAADDCIVCGAGGPWRRGNPQHQEWCSRWAAFNATLTQGFVADSIL